MPDGRVLVAAALVALTVWAGGEVVHGVKKAGHVITAGLVRIVHPHRSDEAGKESPTP